MKGVAGVAHARSGECQAGAGTVGTVVGGGGGGCIVIRIPMGTKCRIGIGMGLA